MTSHRNDKPTLVPRDAWTQASETVAAIEHLLSCCPECQVGKHDNCTGWAYEVETDAVIDCPCKDESHNHG